jgi:hypothetical protein
MVSFWGGDFVVFLHPNTILGWTYCSNPTHIELRHLVTVREIRDGVAR